MVCSYSLGPNRGLASTLALVSWKGPDGAERFSCSRGSGTRASVSHSLAATLGPKPSRMVRALGVASMAFSLSHLHMRILRSMPCAGLCRLERAIYVHERKHVSRLSGRSSIVVGMWFVQRSPMIVISRTWQQRARTRVLQDHGVSKARRGSLWKKPRHLTWVALVKFAEDLERYEK